MRRRRHDDDAAESEPNAASVRPKLMGCIGEDGEVELYREQPQVEVKILGHSIVARQIHGDSLGPYLNGWTLIYDDLRQPPREEFIGQMCAVETTDGSILVKRLYRGRTPGRFDLHSINELPIHLRTPGRFDPSVEPTMRNVALRWAALVLAFFPGRTVPASATDPRK